METKVCKVCKLNKPITEYFTDGQYTFSKCKSCHNTQSKQFRHSKRGKATYRKWVTSDRGREVRKNAMATWTKKNKPKRITGSAVSNAIRDKRLTRKSCVICQTPNAQAHHPDYCKPFKIIWLCRKHHTKFHYPNS